MSEHHVPKGRKPYPDPKPNVGLLGGLPCGCRIVLKPNKSTRICTDPCHDAYAMLADIPMEDRITPPNAERVGAGVAH